MVVISKHWWFTNRKVVEKYVREAKEHIASNEQREIALALNLLEMALSISPSNEEAIELKARCLLNLRRFKDVVTMLQDYLPSIIMSSSLDDSSTTMSSELSPSRLSRERVKLLSSGGDSVDRDQRGFKCFSVSDLKNKVLAGLGRNYEHEGHWRYLVLGQACCRLGMMEDAMVLLQTGKRLATSAFRRRSTCLSEDSFSSFNHRSPLDIAELENASHLLTNIKFLLRRKTAAVAALDAGLFSEAIRHFTKIVDGRRGGPQGFLAECYLYRASAYRSAGRFAEAIADCNRTLALEPSCLGALSSRAALFEMVCCFPDSLHDLEHLKLLYNTILRDRKLPGPAWKHQNVQYREIPGKLCSLATKIQQLKQRVALGKTANNVDYYGLIGLSRGCTRSELERAYRLLMLRNNPEKSVAFIEKCGFTDELEAGSVRDRVKMTSFSLYKLMQKGYNILMETITNEEAAEKIRKKTSDSLHAAQAIQGHKPINILEAPVMVKGSTTTTTATQLVFLHDRVFDNKAGNRTENNNCTSAPAFQGMFCRDLTVAGSLLSQTGFSNPLPLKYEALSC
ncbi:hypothetical protein Leryth_004879 [Lithospermum erythrorhizon]|nr:hypothetical protein Leryth_004879 [Lithospermum erythrorhizon]